MNQAGRNQPDTHHPPSWGYGRDDLTPRLARPGTILAVGNFPLRRNARACSGDPGQPDIQIGRKDALVIVQEDREARAESGPARPSTFRLMKQLRPTDGRPPGTQVFPYTCLNRVGIVGTWYPFGDQGRALSVTAVVGESASPATRSHTLGVLNSLEFAPATPRTR